MAMEEWAKTIQERFVPRQLGRKHAFSTLLIELSDNCQRQQRQAELGTAKGMHRPVTSRRRFQFRR